MTTRTYTFPRTGTTFDCRKISPELGASLRRILKRIGYHDFWGSLLPNNPIDAVLSGICSTLEPRRRDMYMLLATGTMQLTDSIDEDLLAVLRGLAPSGLITEHGSRIGLRGLRLMVLGGLVYFAQVPSGRETLYYGTDSMALSMRLAPEPNEVIIDYCAGPGIQSLVCASRGASVIAVEANSIASDLARCNVALNNLAGEIRVATGSVEEYRITPKSVDRIVANPPLLAIPKGFPYPFVGNGGEDGLRIARQILKSAETGLRNGGELQIIGTTIGNEDGIFAFEELQNWCASCGFYGVLTVIGSFIVTESSPWVQALAGSIALFRSKSDGLFGPRELADAYHATGTTRIFTFHLRLIRSSQGESDDNGLRITQVDLDSVPDSESFWWFQDCLDSYNGALLNV